MDIGLESAVRSDVATPGSSGPRWTVVRVCCRCGATLGTFETSEPPAAPQSHGFCDSCFQQELVDLDWDLYEDAQRFRVRVETELSWQQYYEEGLYQRSSKNTAGE